MSEQCSGFAFKMPAAYLEEKFFWKNIASLQSASAGETTTQMERRGHRLRCERRMV